MVTRGPCARLFCRLDGCRSWCSELAFLRDSRILRAKAMRDRLSELGMPISWERVQQVAGEGSIGRPHLARVLQEEGMVSSTREAFDLYLARGKPAYVARLQDHRCAGAAADQGADGVAVLAHPWGLDDHLADGLAAEGLVGLEILLSGILHLTWWSTYRRSL